MERRMDASLTSLITRANTYLEKLSILMKRYLGFPEDEDAQPLNGPAQSIVTHRCGIALTPESVKEW